MLDGLTQSKLGPPLGTDGRCRKGDCHFKMADDLRASMRSEIQNTNAVGSQRGAARKLSSGANGNASERKIAFPVKRAYWIARTGAAFDLAGETRNGSAAGVL